MSPSPGRRSLPLPPHSAIPGLDLTDWNQLKELSQKQRNLILKVSGFSEQAGRVVSTMDPIYPSRMEQAVDHALNDFESTPYVLQLPQTTLSVRTMV